MNKLNKNESGFSAVELILVIVIVALIGVVGYMVYKNHHKTATTPVVTTSTTKPTTSTKNTSTTTTTSTTPTTSVFKIPELGIQITVPSSLSTLTYNYSTQSSAADMSTSLLASEASSCTANSSTDSANFDALGVLTKGQGTGQKEPDVTIVKQYSTYYISYTEPQDTCLPNGASSSLVNLLSSEQQAFQGSLSTVQLIQ